MYVMLHKTAATFHGYRCCMRDGVNNFLFSKHNVVEIQCFPLIMYLEKDNTYGVDAGHYGGNFFFEIGPFTSRDR
jgi:hypothetical protein